MTDSASDTYLTIDAPAEGFYKEKGSKFYAYSFPVIGEDHVREILQDIRQKHHASRHVCFGYVLGVHGEKFRSNDAGEPSNSAGKPILNQVQSRDLTNVLAIVVRYFGGTKLGVSGLIHAYKTAAAEALNKNKIKVCYVQQYWDLHFSYAEMNVVQKTLRDFQMDILEQQFEESCIIRASVRLSKAEAAENALKKIPNLEIRDL